MWFERSFSAEVNMDADGLPIVGTGVDFTTVAPLNHEKTLSFLNHFITNTVHFLNKFSGVCEEKLEDLNSRIQRMEATLCILEAKLISIPGLESVQSEPQTPKLETSINQSSPPPATSNKSQVQQTEKADIQEEPKPEPETEEAKPTLTVSQDPRYAKYFKMVQVGVPPEALRPKMLVEGLDPALLETPNAPAPEDSTSHQRTDSDSDLGNDSSSDFSD